MAVAKVVGLGRRRFRLLRPLATPDHWHAPIGGGPSIGLYRLPGMHLSFELLRPTPLKSVHDVARQVRSSHVWRSLRDRPPMLGPTVGPSDAVDHSTHKSLPRSILSDRRLIRPHKRRRRRRERCQPRLHSAYKHLMLLLPRNARSVPFQEQHISIFTIANRS
jgi:hypothetical protein